MALCLANWSELRRRAALASEAWLDVVVRSGLFDEVAFFLDCWTKPLRGGCLDCRLALAGLTICSTAHRWGFTPNPTRAPRPGPRQDPSWTSCWFVRYAVKPSQVCLALRESCLDKRQVLIFARFWCLLAFGIARYGRPKETPWTTASSE